MGSIKTRERTGINMEPLGKFLPSCPAAIEPIQYDNILYIEQAAAWQEIWLQVGVVLLEGGVPPPMGPLLTLKENAIRVLFILFSSYFLLSSKLEITVRRKISRPQCLVCLNLTTDPPTHIKKHLTQRLEATLQNQSILIANIFFNFSSQKCLGTITRFHFTCTNLYSVAISSRILASGDLGWRGGGGHFSSAVYFFIF